MLTCRIMLASIHNLSTNYACICAVMYGFTKSLTTAHFYASNALNMDRFKMMYLSTCARLSHVVWNWFTFDANVTQTLVLVIRPTVLNILQQNIIEFHCPETDYNYVHDNY